MSNNSLPPATNSSVSEQSDESTDEHFRFIDDFALLICLGEGGMGEVWAARDASSPKNRIVALKTTKQEGIEAAKVLYDEARIASLIDHPNVCRVHSLCKSEGIQYLVMDYCDGASLHELQQASPDGRLPIETAVRIVSRAAAGLHAAHELLDEDGTHLGVVHRDVSPQNILISTKGAVTVTDFGVAKALGQAHKATETGQMKGKLSYMAPEQVTSKDVDARADLFALACVLYNVTVGKRPFHGDDALSTMYQLLEEDLELPSSLHPDYPKELEAVLVKALSKDREARYQNAEQMQRALDAFLVHSGKAVAEAEVARLMEQYLGPQIAKSTSELRRRNAALSHYDRNHAPEVGAGTGGATGKASEVRSPEQSKSDVRTQDGRSSALEESGVTSKVADGNAAPSRSSSGHASRYLALGIFGAIAIGGSWWIKSNRASDPGSPQAVEGTAPATEPPPSAPETVAIEIDVTPETAEIFLDEKLIATGSYKGAPEHSTRAHLLVVRAKGHQSVTRAIVFDKAQSMTIALSPEEKSVAVQPIASVPIKPKARAAVGTKKPRPLPKKTPAKAPRKLDSDNPFAPQ